MALMQFTVVNVCLELDSGGNSSFLFFIPSLSLCCILCIVLTKDLLQLKRCKETCHTNQGSADRESKYSHTMYDVFVLNSAYCSLKDMNVPVACMCVWSYH